MRVFCCMVAADHARKRRTKSPTQRYVRYYRAPNRGDQHQTETFFFYFIFITSFDTPPTAPPFSLKPLSRPTPNPLSISLKALTPGFHTPNIRLG